MDIEFADFAGDVTELSEEEGGFAGRRSVVRQMSDLPEEHELGLDSASAGAQAANPFFTGIHQNEGDGVLSSGDVVTQGPDGASELWSRCQLRT